MQAANALYPDTEMEQIEDALITGVLRERVGVELVTLEDTWLAGAWLSILSSNPCSTGNLLLSMVASMSSSRTESHCPALSGASSEAAASRYI